MATGGGDLQAQAKWFSRGIDVVMSHEFAYRRWSTAHRLAGREISGQFNTYSVVNCAQIPLDWDQWPIRHL